MDEINVSGKVIKLPSVRTSEVAAVWHMKMRFKTIINGFKLVVLYQMVNETIHFPCVKSTMLLI